MSSKSDIKRLRNAFLVSLGVGFIGIVAGWAVEGWAGQALAFTLTLGVPVSVMGIYIYVGYYMDEANLNTDAFADSVYYMGFLFTLIALVFSLFSITGEGTSTGSLVLRFGVALATTIIGLAVRTILSNFRPSAKDELAKLEHEIEEAAYGLRDRYIYLTDTMTLQTKGFETALTKATGDLNDASEQIKASGNRLKTSSDQAASDLASAIRDLVSTLTETSKEKTEELTNEILQVVSALKGTSEKSTEELTSEINSVVSNFKATSREASRAVKEETESAETMIKSAATNFQQHTSTSFKEMQDGIVSASNDLAKAAEGMKDRISKLDLPDDVFTKKLDPALDKLISSIGKIRADLDDQTEEMPQAKLSIDELVTSLAAANKALADLSQTTSDHKEAVDKLKTQVEDDTSLADKHREELQNAVVESKEALSAIYGELVAATKILEEKVAVQ